ncbi:hypothetical protein U0070_013337, partial [Myodes glareolus]
MIRMEILTTNNLCIWRRTILKCGVTAKIPVDTEITTVSINLGTAGPTQVLVHRSITEKMKRLCRNVILQTFYQLHPVAKQVHLSSALNHYFRQAVQTHKRMLRATFSQVMSLKTKMTGDKAAIKYIQR